MDGVILINKEKSMTSHDVVNIARKSLHTKKVGHLGTLDPDATGLLVLCINKATKALQFIQADEKEYICELYLGKSTDTYDASGKVVETKPFTTIEHLEESLNKFKGTISQLPPIYSAIKVNGKKLYEYARKNQEVEIKPREVEIKELELLDIQDNILKLRVVCSKGTYIRSLCFDLAKDLGYPGHMLSLIRTRCGEFKLENASSIEDLKQSKINVLSLYDALSSYKMITVNNEDDIKCGKKIKSDMNERVVLLNKNKDVLAVYEPDGTGYLKCVRGLF